MKGLHVEPIHLAADDRVRSTPGQPPVPDPRVRAEQVGASRTGSSRACTTDDAYRVARTLYLRLNPVSGTTRSAPTADAHKPGRGRALRVRRPATGR